MKKHRPSSIRSNDKIAPGIYSLVLHCGDLASACSPGQFINIHLDNGALILPRPISICDAQPEQGLVRVVYQAIGKGTEYLSRLAPGADIRITGPLGNGFLLEGHPSIILAGGGIGVPPLLLLAKKLRAAQPKANIYAYLGFRTQSQVILQKEFEQVCSGVILSTDDGSLGFHGNVCASMAELACNARAVYACGPAVMLKSLAGYCVAHNISCQVSMEERMACGLGACVGCVAKIKDGSAQGWGYKKVCKDGPVFYAGEVVWK